MRSGHSRQETEFTDTHGEPKSVIFIKFDLIANQIVILIEFTKKL